MFCSRCSTNLPDGSQFCLKCGQPVMSAANSAAFPTAPTSVSMRRTPLRARQQRRIVVWLFVLVLLGVGLWAATSGGPVAQQVQEFVRWSHAQTILDAPASVTPRSFSSWQFTVPPGALNVSVTGEFSVAVGSPRPGNGSSNDIGKDRDTAIEAYVLTDSAFVDWSSGYSTPTLYQSGPIAGATIDVPLPAGEGAYNLVFSNKISPRAKTVHATVLLRYKSWLPDEVVRLKDRFWNWIGQ